MPIPARERVYETALDRLYLGGLTIAVATRALILQQKNFWLGQSHMGFGGNITLVSPGVFELTPASRGGHALFNAAGNFNNTTYGEGSLVGRKIELRNATTPANNGIFDVVAVPGATSIRYANLAGVAEAFPGDYAVSNGKLTGRGGGFSYWRCKGSSAGSTGKGAGMDGRDRWHSTADLQVGTATNSNRSWFVMENLANGVEILMDWAPVTVFNRIFVYTSSENGFTGGAINARPTATDQSQRTGTGTTQNTGYWFITEDWNTSVIMAMSAALDGEQDFMVLLRGNIPQAVCMTGIVGNPVPGTLIPWTGTKAFAAFPDGRNRNGTAGFLTVAEWNDVARCVVTVDSLGAGPGITPVELFLTQPMNVSGAILERQLTRVQSYDGKRRFDRVGLASEQVSFVGRYGYLPDLMFAGGRSFYTYPADDTREWVQFTDMALPWDGGPTPWDLLT